MRRLLDWLTKPHGSSWACPKCSGRRFIDKGIWLYCKNCGVGLRHSELV